MCTGFGHDGHADSGDDANMMMMMIDYGFGGGMTAMIRLMI